MLSPCHISGWRSINVPTLLKSLSTSKLVSATLRCISIMVPSLGNLLKQYTLCKCTGRSFFAENKKATYTCLVNVHSTDKRRYVKWRRIIQWNTIMFLLCLIGTDMNMHRVHVLKWHYAHYLIVVKLTLIDNIFPKID
jgi:hypothetical protein